MLPILVDRVRWCRPADSDKAEGDDHVKPADH
jgi:hypothetical protein